MLELKTEDKDLLIHKKLDSRKTIKLFISHLLPYAIITYKNITNHHIGGCFAALIIFHTRGIHIDMKLNNYEYEVRRLCVYKVSI